MSKIPIDLPPDNYPVLDRKTRDKDNGVLTFLAAFAVFFALVWLALEIF